MSIMPQNGYTLNIYDLGEDYNSLYSLPISEDFSDENMA